MKFLVTVIFLLTQLTALAHDDHGPKVKDGGKYGGVVAAVVDETKMGKSAVFYKAELVRSEDGTVRIYLFDKAMKAADYSKFDKTISANVEVIKNKKTINKPFTLTLEGNHYKGTAPKAEKRPFNIDVKIGAASMKYFVGFSNLD